MPKQCDIDALVIIRSVDSMSKHSEDSEDILFEGSLKKTPEIRGYPKPDVGGVLSCREAEVCLSPVDGKRGGSSEGAGVVETIALDSFGGPQAMGVDRPTCATRSESCKDDDSSVGEYGVNCFRGEWKTTRYSRLCVVVFRAVLSDGRDAAMWKPEHFASVLRAVSGTRVFEDPSLYEVYANMTFSEKAEWGE